jgi:hypothetical protein
MLRSNVVNRFAEPMIYFMPPIGELGGAQHYLFTRGRAEKDLPMGHCVRALKKLCWNNFRNLALNGLSRL